MGYPSSLLRARSDNIVPLALLSKPLPERIGLLNHLQHLISSAAYNLEPSERRLKPPFVHVTTEGPSGR